MCILNLTLYLHIMHSCINFSVSLWSSLAFVDVVLAYGSDYSSYIFFEADAKGSMYQILVSLFEMDNVVYGLFAIEALSIVNTLFSDLLNLIILCE